MRLILKDCNIFDGNSSYNADIFIENGKISKIGKNLDDKADKIIEVNGLQVLPGAIDVHTHINLPVGSMTTSDDFFTGSKSAVYGGVTTFIDFVTPEPNESLYEALNKRRSLIDNNSIIDYSLHMGIVKLNNSILNEMINLVNDGITSFKMFMTYKSRNIMSDDYMLRKALEFSNQYNALIMVHAENDSLIEGKISELKDNNIQLNMLYHNIVRDNLSEYEAVNRVVSISESVNGNLYIVHLSTEEGANIIIDSRNRGFNTFTETCPQYLYFTKEEYQKDNGHHYATCPPLREQKDLEFLNICIEDGLINIVSTDHCSFTPEQKDKWQNDITKLFFGIPGIETFFPSIYTKFYKNGSLDLNRIVNITSTMPAKMFGLKNKGSIKIGEDADIIIVDPEYSKIVTADKLHMNNSFTQFKGFELFGFPKYVITNGKIVLENYEYKEIEKNGKFIKREKFLL